MARRKAADNALVVRTFSYPTTTVGNDREDTGTRPLAGCTVTITQGPGPLPPQQQTGTDGEVRFENLPEGPNYRIAVQQPGGFQAPPAQGVFVDGRGPFAFNQDIIVPEGGERVLDVGMAPSLALVRVTVGITRPAGLPAAPNRNGIRVEARNAGLLVDSRTTGAAAAIPANPPIPAIPRTRTGECILRIDRPGLIEIVPVGSIQRSGRTFNPRPEHARQFLVVAPGDTNGRADIQYEPTRAEILVGAQRVEEVDGQEERTALDGVTFQLFVQGNPDPIRELVTRQQTVSAFSDLQAGSYRIVPRLPELSNGQRLQLTRPSTPALSIQVNDGQRIDLTHEFEFEPTRGSVIGSVVVSRDDTPVPGVAVVLSSQQEPQIVRRAVTDVDGGYGIDEVPPGRYRVAPEQAVVVALGTRFELEGDGDPGRTVEVRPRATTLVPDFRLVEEEHLVTGEVFGPGGVGAAYVTVQVFDDPRAAQPIANVLTDQSGTWQYRASRPGTYYYRVLEQDGFAPQLTPVTVNRPTRATPLFTSLRTHGVGGVGAAGTGVTGATSQAAGLQDLNDFPFLTEEVDLGGGAGPAPAAGEAGAVGQTVERALRDVLGWRPRTNDPKGFQAALVRAFTAEEMAGHTEYRWNPRSYAVEIQADLGAVTGAQASLYTRAKGTVEQVLPLVDGLKPLRVDFDPENVDAIRAIVQTELTELAEELGVEGGPRVQRVDQLFGFLLGDDPFDDLDILRDPDKVQGTLGVLRDRLGLNRKRINTIEEEQNFTNFLVVVDHVVSLAESWDAQRQFFVRGSAVEPFLGTQLVLLSRDLEVIAESVHEVEFAMNSVFLGPAERQTLELRFPATPQTGTGQQTGAPIIAGTPPMFVSELLSWVERFATEEGRQLIDEGGRQGVVAFRPTILLLQALVQAAQVTPAGLQDPTRMPAAYRRQRVQRALRELADQLAGAAERVALIQAPVEDGPDGQPPATPTTQPGTVQPRRQRRPRQPAGDNGQQPQPSVMT
jgi:hypothetical protein